VGVGIVISREPYLYLKILTYTFLSVYSFGKIMTFLFYSFGLEGAVAETGGLFCLRGFILFGGRSTWSGGGVAELRRSSGLGSGNGGGVGVDTF